MAVVGYVLRLLFVGLTPSNPLLALIADAVVIALTIWALVPGRDQFGPDFGKRTNWTGIFVIPLGLGILLAIRDFVLLARELGA